ncbi:MAG TPA: hypothetical protein VNJ09_04430, partial [Chthonomonadales bacterium]|nr:hypothetical protein [Chthonomonadales bacterium]
MSPSRMMVFALATLVLLLLGNAFLPAAAKPAADAYQKKRGQGMTERFIPLEGMTVACDSLPTEAEILAVRHFTKEIQRMTGKSLPVEWGDRFVNRACILVGNHSTLEPYIAEGGYHLPAGSDSEDIRNQSYMIDVRASNGAKHPVVLAAGFGKHRTARGYLGTSYALGELLRRLDLCNGQWGFVLPPQPIIASPRMPNRTLYLMNSDNCNPGLSLEYFRDEQLEEYVD